MKTIEYRLRFNEGDDVIVRVEAQSINSGAPKALAKGLAASPGREFHALDFWQVVFPSALDREKAERVRAALVWERS